MKKEIFYIIPSVIIAILAAIYFFITNTPQNSVEKTEGKMDKMEKTYMDYSKENFENAINNNKNVVLFFHASWCPDCRAADNMFIENTDDIPNDIVLFKIDYDNSEDLKKQYALTTQHTFVQIDKDMNMITKWIGGNIPELKANIQ